jgi:2-polyprenyl-3-methyl-5-hydroxy-6-metoxy-1,4-benzoquinol methylase
MPKQLHREPRVGRQVLVTQAGGFNLQEPYGSTALEWKPGSGGSFADVQDRPSPSAARERLSPETAPLTDRLFHEARYYFATKWAVGQRVLDVACGVGYGSRILAESGARMVVGLDYPSEAVKHANSRYRQECTSFVRSDAVRLPFCSELFDLIVSFETIEHLQNPVGFIEGCVRSLRPDGWFIVSTPNSRGLPVGLKHSPFHIREFRLAELNSLLGQYFAEIEIFWQAWPEQSIAAHRALWLSSDLHALPGVSLLRSLLPGRARSLFRRLLVSACEYQVRKPVEHAPLPLSCVKGERGACVYLAVCRGKCTRTDTREQTSEELATTTGGAGTVGESSPHVKGGGDQVQ